MKASGQLSRSQKVAMLAKLMGGNAAAVTHYKQEQEKPFAYVVNCYQVLPVGRINTLDRRPDDRITGIKVTRSYYEGKPNEVDHLPDMSRAEFERWQNERRESGNLVVGMIGTRYAGQP